MNNVQLRKALEKKGLSPVGALYVVHAFQVPHVVSMLLRVEDRTMWEVTYDGTDYFLEKSQI